jgi:hypothetical protein
VEVQSFFAYLEPIAQILDRIQRLLQRVGFCLSRRSCHDEPLFLESLDNPFGNPIHEQVREISDYMLVVIFHIAGKITAYL